MDTISAMGRSIYVGAGEYDHRQYAPLYWMILAPAIFIGVMAFAASDNPKGTFVMLSTSGFLVATALSFRWLRVVDEVTHLAIRFGPFPLLRRRIPYANLTAAERDRSSLVDSWGIHWVPGRGWIFNLWGFDCVRLTLRNGRTTRIGTDDPDGLTSFLQQKLREA